MKFTLDIAGKRASDLNPDWILNCFALVKCYCDGELKNGVLSAQEFLEWLQANTAQVDEPKADDLFVVWIDGEHPTTMPEVRIAELLREKPGYPFGLIMEHAGVLVSSYEIFHKASPRDEDPFLISDFKKILKQYQFLKWHKITFHRFAANKHAP
jgi:hypothetical protein